MSEKNKGSILKPFKSLKYLGEKPVTIKVPYEYRPTAERYRGFHINDWDKCIGCGTCAEICDNDAIRMIEIPSIEPKQGATNLRPAIDYGRCCWCALCVDMCTTNSLQMTQEYIHIDDNLDSFFILPNMNGIHNKEYPLGYIADDEVNFLDLERVPMEELPAEERIKSFIEIVRGYSKELAIKEASRCVACGLCTDTCPANMNIPEYIDAIWNDNLDEAARQIYKTNPLPEVCGRVCTHKCEDACSLGVRGEPIAIRWLKRYAMDNIPLEEYNRAINSNVVKHNNKKIAIIGAGPAGLAAAYYLSLMGYKITIFEKLPQPGGMMRYGIPEYRLPYDMLDKDIKFIEQMGAEIKCNMEIGKDVTIEQLQKDFDSVLVSTGLHVGRSTRVKGTDHQDVFQAINLLREITMGNKIKVEKKIIVIGGGNVAMDIARSLARLQIQKYGEVNIIVTSLETRDIMPADEEEIIEAEEEGVIFYPGRGPKEIVIENDKIKGLKTIKCTRVFDENNRFAPEFDESDELFLEGSMVVEAIGQAPDLGLLKPIENQLIFDGRRIKVDKYYQTNLKWLFVAGDIIKGPDVITGIRTGHDAAIGIDKYLTQKSPKEIRTIDELLDYAIQFEINSYNFYSMLLEKVPKNLKPVIEDLVKQEELHRDNLESIKNNKNIKIFLTQELKRSLIETNLAEFIKPAKIKEDATIEDILQIAIIREKSAYQFYRDFEKLTKNKELEFLLKYLMNEELKHQKRLETLYYKEIYQK